jgi:hypothetical protein
MAEDHSAEATWLPVIGKALAYLCLSTAQERSPEKYKHLLKRVKFLQGLGLTRGDAAGAAGSSAKSVAELHSRASRKTGRQHGRAKKKTRR